MMRASLEARYAEVRSALEKSYNLWLLDHRQQWSALR